MIRSMHFVQKSWTYNKLSHPSTGDAVSLLRGSNHVLSTIYLALALQQGIQIKNKISEQTQALGNTKPAIQGSKTSSVPLSQL
jgi:hypothetical protein